MIDYSLLEVRRQRDKYVFYYQGSRMAVVKCYLRNAELVGAIKAANDQINNQANERAGSPKVRSLAAAQMKKFLPADLDLQPEDLLGYEVSPCSEMKKIAMLGPREEYQHLMDYIREMALQRFVNDLIKLVRDDVRRALDDYIDEAYRLIEQNEHKLWTVFHKRTENTIASLKTQLDDHQLSSGQWDIIFQNFLDSQQYAFALGYAYVRWETREHE